jgi:hypothetical protein
LSHDEGGVSSEPESGQPDSPASDAFRCGVPVALREAMRCLNPLRFASVSLLTWGLLTAGPLAGSVAAVTPAELAELAKAGLGDEVLLALVESTGLPEPIDAASAIALKRGGVSDRVIAAAIRVSQPPPSAPDPEPLAYCAGCAETATEATMYPSAIEIHAPAMVEREVYREVREVYVYVPVTVAPPVHRPRQRPAKPYFEGDRGFGRFINDGVTLPRDSKGTPRR